MELVLFYLSLFFILYFIFLFDFILVLFYILYFGLRQRNVMLQSIEISLLSLILLFSIIVLNRKLVNMYFSFNLSLSSNSQVYYNIAINIDINTPRDWSVNSSANNSKKFSVHSNILYIYQ